MSSRVQCCRVTVIEFGWSKSEHRAFWSETEQCLAHRLEMRLATLILLDHRVNVTEPPLEGVALEDRCRPRRVVGRVDDVARLVDGPGRGEPDGRVVICRQPSRPADIPPDLVERAQQKGARTTQPRFRLGDLRLNHVVIAQGAFGTARDLVAGEFDKSVERAPRDTEGYPGKARCVDIAAAKGVKQARLAWLGCGVAQHRVLLGYEQIGDRVAVAAGAAQADDMPDIGKAGACFREQQGTHDRAAVRPQLRRSARVEDRNMSAEPGGVMAAAGKAPGSAKPIAAGHRTRVGGARRAPCDDPASGAED